MKFKNSILDYFIANQKFLLSECEVMRFISTKHSFFRFMLNSNSNYTLDIFNENEIVVKKLDEIVYNIFIDNESIETALEKAKFLSTKNKRHSDISNALIDSLTIKDTSCPSMLWTEMMKTYSFFKGSEFSFSMSTKSISFKAYKIDKKITIDLLSNRKLRICNSKRKIDVDFFEIVEEIAKIYSLLTVDGNEFYKNKIRSLRLHQLI